MTSCNGLQVYNVVPYSRTLCSLSLHTPAAYCIWLTNSAFPKHDADVPFWGFICFFNYLNAKIFHTSAIIMENAQTKVCTLCWSFGVYEKLHIV